MGVTPGLWRGGEEAWWTDRRSEGREDASPRISAPPASGKVNQDPEGKTESPALCAGFERLGFILLGCETAQSFPPAFAAPPGGTLLQHLLGQEGLPASPPPGVCSGPIWGQVPSKQS